jgi:acetyl esterase/lipase
MKDGANRNIDVAIRPAVRVAGRRVGLLSCAVLAALVCNVHPGACLAAEPSVKIDRDVTYVVRGDRPLKADVYLPAGEGPFAGVLCVHGGAWATGSKSQMGAICQRLAEEGHVAVAIQYRLAPRDKFPAQIEDCRAAVGWMQQNAERYSMDPKRLAAWGYSAGGHLVALLGASDKGLKAIVAGGAPCDFRQVPPDERVLAFWLGGTRAELPDVYNSASPAAFVSRDDPPMFFYHGRRDRLVKVSDPRAMVSRLKELGVAARLYEIPQEGHIRAFVNPKAVAEALKFLDEHL